MPRKKKEKFQPCWTCTKSCGGCSWSRSFKPIDGWKAKPTIIAGQGDEFSSYEIEYCPEYEKEKKKRKRIKDL